jgi:hypothetical protein
MDLGELSKTELLEKCEELGITKCKSKNKGELIDLINSKSQQIKEKPKIELIIEEDDNNPSNIEQDIHVADDKIIILNADCMIELNKLHKFLEL